SRTTTPSSILASTSAQGRRGASPSTGVATAFGRARNLEVVPVAAVGPAARVVVLGVAAGLELVDHLVEVVARVLAQLLPHLPHPARQALRVVLVEPGERGGVREVVQPAVLGAHHRETGHEPGEIATAAAVADGVDRFAGAQGEDGDLTLARAAAVLVDRHRR